MTENPVERTWQVPGGQGQGPVTMTLRIPEVIITDSSGRYIVVSPQQSELLGTRMADIGCLLEEWGSGLKEV